MEELSIVGKSFRRLDAVDKATGKAVYGSDIRLPHMLFGKILTSPYPHAKILNIDAKKAERLIGVKAVVTAQDVADVRWGFLLKDQTLFAKDKVRFVGEAVAALAATDKYTAEEALELIKVEYEELPAIFDPEEAIKPETPLIHEAIDSYVTIWPCIKYGNIASHIKIQRGDAEKGFKESDSVFEDRFTTKPQHHGYIEPRASLASIDPSGKVTVWTTIQAPFMIRMELAETLRIPMNKIRIITNQVGGGFGGKTDIFLEPYCTVLAQKTAKPVKMALTRKEEFTIFGHRLPCIIEIKTGVKKDGQFMARQAKLIYDTGAYAGVGPGVVGLGANYCLGPYKILNLKIDGYCVYTNRIRGWWMRGPGAVQSNFASESQIDIIAEKLGVDPLELRLKNATKEGELSVTGQVLHGVGIKEALSKATEKAGWGKPLEKKQGRGISCCQYETVGMGASAHVRINEDGTIGLIIGTVDIGGGSITVLAQILAEELGVPLEDITVTYGDTDATPYDAGTFGDRVTYNMGNAVRLAALDAKGQLLQITAAMLEAKPEDLEMKDKRIYVKGSPERGIPLGELAMASHFFAGGPLIGKGSFFAQLPPYYQEGVEGHPFPSSPAHTFASQVSEVEIDEKTGKVKVLKITSAHDVGFAINPMAVEGQIEGSTIIGLGFALTEQLKEENGKIINPEFLDYRIPITLDIPKVETIIVEEKVKDGPFGAKGAGNPGLILAPAAIANAIAAATGIRIKDLPITPEKLWKALKERGKVSVQPSAISNQ